MMPRIYMFYHFFIFLKIFNYEFYFQESNGISDAINSPRSPAGSDRILAKDDKAPDSSGYGLFGRLPFLSRTRSATDAVLQHTRSSAC